MCYCLYELIPSVYEYNLFYGRFRICRVQAEPSTTIARACYRQRFKAEH
jgi:hypothetical protein